MGHPKKTGFSHKGHDDQLNNFKQGNDMIQSYCRKIILEPMRKTDWRVGRPACNHSDEAWQDEG